MCSNWLVVMYILHLTYKSEMYVNYVVVYLNKVNVQRNNI